MNSSVPSNRSVLNLDTKHQITIACIQVIAACNPIGTNRSTKKLSPVFRLVMFHMITATFTLLMADRPTRSFAYQAIARNIGASCESVSRLLSDWKQRAVIRVSAGRITVRATRPRSSNSFELLRRSLFSRVCVIDQTSKPRGVAAAPPHQCLIPSDQNTDRPVRFYWRFSASRAFCAA